MGIGNKLDTLLKERGMTVTELARRVDVAPTTIYSIIQRNNKKVDIDVLIKIARILGVNTEYFSDSNDEPSYDTEYYLNQQTAEMAEFLMHNPEYKVLFDASRKVKPEDIEKALTALGLFSE